MTGAEQGYLLLTSHLGDPHRKILTVPQLRELFSRMGASKPEDPDRQLVQEDIMALGYRRDYAQRILELLSEEERLRWYLSRGRGLGCVPITRPGTGYPRQLIQRLQGEAPGCLWAKGDLTLLEKPMIALVGSRALRRENREFAARVGAEAAYQGYVLVSGNARGADRAAQEACLAAGGSVVSVVADCLADQPARENLLYLSEDGYDLPFSAQRALLRNRIIHSLGIVTLVAQCGLGRGGTWDGSLRNLDAGWSQLYCFDDGSDAALELYQRGASLILADKLQNLDDLRPEAGSFFDQC